MLRIKDELIAEHFYIAPTLYSHRSFLRSSYVVPNMKYYIFSSLSVPSPNVYCL